MASKNAIREELRKQRNALSAELVAAASQSIQSTLLNLTAVRDARTWLVYVSFGREVVTHPLIRELLLRDCTVAAPLVIGAGEMIFRQIRSLDELKRGEFGILAPPVGEPFTVAIDVCVCPGVAFTERGERLGSGGGFYDRFLAAHSPRLCIGLAMEFQIVPELPLELHDRPMDYVITENRVIKRPT